MPKRSTVRCTVPDCDSGQPHKALGLCKLHYQRQRIRGNVGGGEREKGPKRSSRGIDSRLCPRCKQVLPPEKFYNYNAVYCIPCTSEYGKERRNGPNRERILEQQRESWARRMADPEKAAADRKARAMKRYSLTAEEFDRLITPGACTVCGRADAGWARSKTLHIDHGHGNGRVRGLLCVDCNLGLSRFKDDPVLLERAAAYLRDQITQPAPVRDVMS